MTRRASDKSISWKTRNRDVSVGNRDTHPRSRTWFLELNSLLDTRVSRFPLSTCLTFFYLHGFVQPPPCCLHLGYLRRCIYTVTVGRVLAMWMHGRQRRCKSPGYYILRQVIVEVLYPFQNPLHVQQPDHSCSLHARVKKLFVRLCSISRPALMLRMFAFMGNAVYVANRELHGCHISARLWISTRSMDVLESSLNTCKVECRMEHDQARCECIPIMGAIVYSKLGED